MVIISNVGLGVRNQKENRFSGSIYNKSTRGRTVRRSAKGMVSGLLRIRITHSGIDTVPGGKGIADSTGLRLTGCRLGVGGDILIKE